MKIKLFNLDNKKTYIADFVGHGTEKKSICPVCSHTRKKKKDKILSYNEVSEVAFCHHCNTSFQKFRLYQKTEKIYKRPEWKNTTELSDKTIKFFESRKISQTVVKNMKITSGIEYMPQFNKEVDTIQFNYFLDSELINIKYRGVNKAFKLNKDSELIFYNLDAIKETNECIIVEGELDCLSFIQSGRLDVVSVPAGASTNTEYLDNYLEYFENKEKIFIATDNDLKGIELRDELVRRLGVEKCYKVNFKDCKDANEYHIKYGGQNLHELLKEAKEFPISGLFGVKDFKEEIFNLYYKGLQKGYLIGGDHDEYISFEKGRVYTITGIPNHGKSEWLDFVLSKLMIIHGLKFEYFSPENHPTELHISKLVSQSVGKKFATDNLQRNDLENTIDYLNNHVWFIKPENEYNLDTILEIAKQGVEKYGINGIVIDPYNKLEHNRPSNMNETDYVSKFYDKLINFGIKYNLLTFLVAHPVKMQKKTDGLHEVPNLYSISGSANFYNKTDFGITVYRNFETGNSEIYIQKAKFKHLGTVGMVNQAYNINNGRYSDLDTLTGATNYDNSCWLQQKTENNFNFEDVKDLNEDIF